MGSISKFLKRNRRLQAWLAKQDKKTDFDLNKFNVSDTRIKQASRLDPPLKVSTWWQIQALSGDVSFYQDFTFAEKDNWDANVAHYAAWSGNLEALKWIADHKAHLLHIHNKYQTTIAHYAAWSGNLQLLEWIESEEGLKDILWIKNNFNLSISHMAALSGQINILEWIQHRSAETLLLTDRFEGGIAHYAAMAGSIKTLQWIKENYFESMTAVSKFYYSFAHEIIETDNPKLLDWLLKEFSTLVTRGYTDQSSLLRTAVSSNALQIIDRLVAIGFDIHEKDEKGKDLVHDAIKFETAKHLVRNYGLKPPEKYPLSWSTDCGPERPDLNESYQAYLTSFTVIEALHVLFYYNISNIITNYAGAAVSSNWTSVQDDIKQKIIRRNKVLQPLIDYCETNFFLALQNGARVLLNTLKISINIDQLEKKLDYFLPLNKEKLYFVCILECRINTVAMTGNYLPIEYAEGNAGIIAQYKSLKASYIELQDTYQVSERKVNTLQEELKLAEEANIASKTYHTNQAKALQASYHFQLHCLIACGASTMSLAIGIILLCLPPSLPSIIGGSTLFLIGTVGSALSANSFFKTKDPMQNPPIFPTSIVVTGV